jgi:hypothetical protein
MMNVSRFVRNGIAIVMQVMYGTQDLSRFKNHLDYVHVTMHNGSQRRGVV